MTDSIEFDSEELEAASHWHGDQSSMLYAITSTGSLKRGTVRPRRECECCEGCATCNGTMRVALTDAEWFADLASRLESEASDAIESAEEQLADLDGHDADEECDQLLADIEGLRSIEHKAAKCT